MDSHLFRGFSDEGDPRFYDPGALLGTNVHLGYISPNWDHLHWLSFGHVHDISSVSDQESSWDRLPSYTTTDSNVQPIKKNKNSINLCTKGPAMIDGLVTFRIRRQDFPNKMATRSLHSPNSRKYVSRLHNLSLASSNRSKTHRLSIYFTRMNRGIETGLMNNLLTSPK